MKCLHYFSDVRLDHGGVVRAVLDLVAALPPAGVQTTLAVHVADDVPQTWLSETPGLPLAIQCPRADAGSVVKAVDRNSRLAAEIRACDVLHLHTPWYPANRAVSRYAAAVGKPYVLTVHGMLDDWCMAQKRVKKQLYMHLFGKSMLEGAAFVHCTAQAEADQSSPWFPAGRSRVLPCVIDLEPYRELPDPQLARSTYPALTRPGTKLLFLSRLHEKKGVERLIDAAALLAARGLEFQLLIAGPGEPAYAEALRQKAKAAGLDERVTFPGMVRGELKYALYAAADLFVLPTYQENFGLVSPEAMLCQTPVLTTRGVDIWKELEAGGAMIVDVDADADALAEALAHAIQRHDTLNELGRRGRDFILDWLDPKQVAEGYARMYRDAIDLQRSSTS